MIKERPKKLVLGIGNVLLRDEGVGVRIIEYLRQLEIPADVEVVDGGTAGADLIDVLADRDKVVIVDAVCWDGEPGTVLKLRPEELSDHEKPLSLHELDVPQTLKMTKMLGCAPKEVVFYGVVPQSIEPGIELSAAILALVPIVAQKIMHELE